MGYSELINPHRQKTKSNSRRRSYIPEPPYSSTSQVYQVAFSQDVSRRRNHKKRSTARTQVTHTSCLTAIRNYVIRMQRPKKRKRKHHKKTVDNAEKLICSLKNDIQVISKYQQDVACHPDRMHSTDPFFLLSAMMCKMNKLEDLVMRSTDNEKQVTKRRDMLITVKCIKNNIMEQMRCDEQLLKEKQKKLCYLVKSLEMFERQIRCMMKATKYKSSSPKVPGSPKQSKSCICFCHLKEDCSPKCPGKIEEPSCPPPPCPPPPCPPPPCPPPPCPPQPVCSNPPCSTTCNAPCSQQLSPVAPTYPIVPSTPCDPCGEAPGKYDITGVSMTYTKSRLQGDSLGRQTELVRNKICCSMGEDDDYKLTVMRGDNECPIDPCENPELKRRLDNMSKLWLESARQLMDSFCA